MECRHQVLCTDVPSQKEMIARYRIDVWLLIRQCQSREYSFSPYRQGELSNTHEPLISARESALRLIMMVKEWNVLKVRSPGS